MARSEKKITEVDKVKELTPTFQYTVLININIIAIAYFNQQEPPIRYMKKLKCLACDSKYPYKKEWVWCPKCNGVLVD